MEKNTSDARFGAFILLAAVLVVLAVFVVGRTGSNPRETLNLVLPAAPGIRIGSSVLVTGVEMGKVQGIRPFRDVRTGNLAVQLTLAVDRTLFEQDILREDTTGLVLPDFTGNASIILSGGNTDSSGPLKPGSSIDGQVRPGMEEISLRLWETVERFAGASATIERIAINLENGIANPEVQKKLEGLITETGLLISGDVRSLVGNLDGMVRENRPLLENSLKGFSSASQTFRTASESASTAIQETQNQITELRRQAQQVLADFAGLMRESGNDLETSLERFTAGVNGIETGFQDAIRSWQSTNSTFESSIVDSRKKLEEVLGALGNTTHELTELLKKMNENPSLWSPASRTPTGTEEPRTVPTPRPTAASSTEESATP